MDDGPISILDRMVNAVEKVRVRLVRSTSALGRAGVPYAVVGGNAVAAWVGSVDETAVRNTRDVDLLIRREDLPRVRVALEAEGFVYRLGDGIDMFLDGPESKARDAVHIIFSGERVRPADPFPNPTVEESERFPEFQVLSLDALVRVKLAVFRDKDRMHLRDVASVGLIDESWPARMPAELGERSRHILDTPDG